jgi:hypothetical protein
MKKSKIFMAAGALALTISAIFATKASKKFAPGLTTAYFSGSSVTGFIKGAAIFTTAGNVSGYLPAYMSVCTSGGSAITTPLELVKTADDDTHQLYVNH